MLSQKIVQIQQYVSVFQIKSVDLLKKFITRLDKINPILNCLVEERFDAALKEAAEADELIASGSMTEAQLAKEKPLLGVPFTTKDCIMVKGKFNSKTTLKLVLLCFPCGDFNIF